MMALLFSRLPHGGYLLSLALDLWLFATLFAFAMRRVPPARWARLERRYPRMRPLARACRKFGTDVEPFLRELVLVAKGTPPEEKPLESTRETRPPEPPEEFPETPAEKP